MPSDANGVPSEGTGAVQRGVPDWRRGGYDPFANSAHMRTVKRMIDCVGPTDATILISGDSGVGKEIVARATHYESPRRHRPFIKVNCAALPMDLLESELFGHERGAFTGAYRRKPGKFELANGGTIFLDEIGELPLPLQAKILHVLQDREFSSLGGRQDVRVDVRVIAATNKDLAALVDLGRFREDLYYRLNVVNIYVPLLRDRREEIPGLVDYFLERYSRQYMRPPHNISPATLELFQTYSWPGNIRELENVVKRIVVLGSDDWSAQVLSPTHVPPISSPAIPKPLLPPPPPLSRVRKEKPGLRSIGRVAALEAERGALKETLDRVHWNRREAARLLNVSYRTLRRKIQECGLQD